MTLFADDSANRCTAKNMVELERRMTRGLERVFRSMRGSRLKVNPDKTTYMVIAGPGRRARDDLRSTLTVEGELIEAKRVGKSLGLLINDNLTWEAQTKKLVADCRKRMGALYRVTSLLSQEERKIKAEAVILSKLRYCLEATSTGRKRDLEALQSIQSQTARWVLGRSRLNWSLSGGLKELCWLSMAQLVCYTSVRMALKVIQKQGPESLLERLTEVKTVTRKRRRGEEDPEKQEERVPKKITWEELTILKASTRKAWSIRAIRWMAKIPSNIKDLPVGGEAGKKELKMWVRRHIHVRGDRILWGRQLERTRDEDEELSSDEGGDEDFRGGNATQEDRQEAAGGQEEQLGEQGQQRQVVEERVEQGDHQLTTHLASSPTREQGYGHENLRHQQDWEVGRGVELGDWWRSGLHLQHPTPLAPPTHEEQEELEQGQQEGEQGSAGADSGGQVGITACFRSAASAGHQGPGIQVMADSYITLTNRTIARGIKQRTSPRRRDSQEAAGGQEEQQGEQGQQRQVVEERVELGDRWKSVLHHQLPTHLASSQTREQGYDLEDLGHQQEGEQGGAGVNGGGQVGITACFSSAASAGHRGPSIQVMADSYRTSTNHTIWRRIQQKILPRRRVNRISSKQQDRRSRGRQGRRSGECVGGVRGARRGTKQEQADRSRRGLHMRTGVG